MSERDAPTGHQVNLGDSENTGTIIAGEGNEVRGGPGQASPPDEGVAWKRAGIAAGVVGAIAAVVALFMS